jgi:putative ABC transport system substrate-binding protein
VQAIAAPVRDAADIEPAVAGFSRQPSGGLIFPTDSFTLQHRDLIVDLAAKNRLPAAYAAREFVDAGGLIAYAVNFPDLFRRAAAYVDKILKGAKPADLPVQQPTKFELTINLKTAKALDLAVPLHLQQLADEVIE